MKKRKGLMTPAVYDEEMYQASGRNFADALAFVWALLAMLMIYASWGHPYGLVMAYDGDVIQPTCDACKYAESGSAAWWLCWFLSCI